MPKEIIITECMSCPLSDMLDMLSGYQCNIDKQEPKRIIPESKQTYMPETPDWCPLKSGDVVLKFSNIT